MIADDILVYLDPDGKSYVALIGETWQRWPAVEQGWLSRQGCAPSLAERCYELEPRLAALALRLTHSTALRGVES